MSKPWAFNLIRNSISKMSESVVHLSCGRGDPLVLTFALVARILEKWGETPFRFPDTVCYEHHFPRAWYGFETDASQQPPGRSRPQNPLESLRQATPYLQIKQQRPSDRRARHPERANLSLFKKPPKECDNGTITRSFSCSPRSAMSLNAQQRSTCFIGSTCVIRDKISNELVFWVLDDASLADFLMNTPETCILSRNTPLPIRLTVLSLTDWRRIAHLG